MLTSQLVAEDSSNLRLDRKVIPTFEAVELHINADRPDYTGSAHIELCVREATHSFTFHAEEIALNTVVLKSENGRIKLTFTTGETGLITVTTESPLSPGNYTLDIEFSNRFNTQSVGLYRVETGGYAYIFTQFEAWDARKAFPCWDEPAFKIPYQLTLIVPEDHLAITNTPIQQETITNGTKRVVFERIPPTPSYLLAIATGSFEAVPIPGLSVPGRIITVKGSAHLAAEAVKVAPPILRGLEAYFGRPYPYKKLDIIGVPEFMFGAMENPGAVTFRDSFLLFDPDATGVAQRRRLAAFLTHELAHIWFGDLVTMTWWDDLWLNESFASWLGDKVTDEIFPQYKIAVTQVSEAQWAMEEDTRLSARSIRQPVSPRDNPEQSFDALAYQKGQSVLEMFEYWMGADIFRRGVLDYMQAHEWGNTVADDLWASLSKAAGRDVGKSISTFIDQPGIPMVGADLLPDGYVMLSQERFLSYGVEAPASELWEIPVVLRYPDGDTIRTQEVLLTQTVQTFLLSVKTTPVWIHPNSGERGYYRWRVPQEMLLSMAKDSQRLLSVRERVGIINHLSALLDAGYLTGDIYLQVIGYFAEDPWHEVIMALVDALGKIWGDFVAEVEGLDDPFAFYIQRTLGPALRRFGLSKAKGEEEAVSLLRPRLIGWLGNRGHDEKVLAYADSLAHAYMQAPSSIDPDLAEVTLGVTASRGDRALFDLYKKRFETTTMPTERANYLSALGKFRDSGVVQAALQYELDGPIRPHEHERIPYGIANSSPRYRDRVFAWMTENYDVIISKKPLESAAYLPWFANGCSEARLETARRFFAEPSHRPVGTEKELEKVGEDVMRRVGVRRREGHSVAAYFRKL